LGGYITPMSGPLVGKRVLDLTRVVAGPWATQLLADLGAEVIKVERPRTGDECRGFGPPFVNSRSGATPQSVYFASTNRGKRSITIDIANPAGQFLVRELAEVSDVFVENYKVGKLTELGLDYANLAEKNRGLVYCSITGFGQTGPHRFRPGYDILIQAMGGFMSITGEPDREPMKSGVAIADILTALYASNAIVAALCERAESGLGQYIDLALLDVQIAALANQAANFLTMGVASQRRGNAHESIVPYQSFKTRDGSMIVGVANDAQFIRFAKIVGLPEMASDVRFRTNAERVRNRAELLPAISERLLQRTTSEWCADFDREQIPAGPVNTIGEVFDEPQVKARDLTVEFPAGIYEARRVVGNPIRYSRTPVSYELPPPDLGQDTDYVLSNVLHKDREAIQKLHNENVV
jgi:crotonobetainyl-CoA:carnitine CoA-transferase CaiB-like acyl-CoA transferase